MSNWSNLAISEIFQTFFRNISEIVKTRVYFRNISQINQIKDDGQQAGP